MVDMPWTPEKTAVLLDWVEKELKTKVEMAIIGHHHPDCLGGLPEIHWRGIRSIDLDKARELALAKGFGAPKETFGGTRKIRIV
ncbi:MAG: hypothetical protein JXO51_02240, partial [Candidatus Aminicenantes bacterium]|nr:hypothetical protein [Candidatus Aminicenantes bacterium]